MPTTAVKVPYADFIAQSDRHRRVIQGVPSIEVKLQRLIAELVMMRLFDEFQAAIAGIASRLACGASYGDGTSPILLTAPAASAAAAVRLFEQYQRTNTKRAIWSRADFVVATTEKVLDSSDHFAAACQAHSLIYSDMQAIRNRIAHSNHRARRSYAAVVRRHYGATMNHITPGTLLLSPRFSPTLIDTYLTASRVIVKSSARL